MTGMHWRGKIVQEGFSDQTYPEEVHGIGPKENAAKEEKKRSASSSTLPKDQSPLRGKPGFKKLSN